MIIDSILKALGIREKSLAERVTNKVLSGYEPSEMAKTVVGKLSDRKINDMLNVAKERQNEDVASKNE